MKYISCIILLAGIWGCTATQTGNRETTTPDKMKASLLHNWHFEEREQPIENLFLDYNTIISHDFAFYSDETKAKWLKEGKTIKQDSIRRRSSFFMELKNDDTYSMAWTSYQSTTAYQRIQGKWSISADTLILHYESFDTESDGKVQTITLSNPFFDTIKAKVRLEGDYLLLYPIAATEDTAQISVKLDASMSDEQIIKALGLDPKKLNAEKFNGKDGASYIYSDKTAGIRVNITRSIVTGVYVGYTDEKGAYKSWKLGKISKAIK